MIKNTPISQLTEKEKSFLFKSRDLIDQENEEIIRHISKRIGLARGVMRYKKKKGLPIFDGEREKKIRSGMVKFAVSSQLKLDKK
ncbi:MAG: chorismate mutase [Candidatus Nealsonbacteria bacterium]